MKKLFIIIGFASIFSASLLAKESKRGKIVRELNMLKVGDTFKFSYLIIPSEPDCQEIPRPKLKREISTYGEENISAKIGVTYQVIEKSRNFYFKGQKGLRKNNKRQRILQVKQIEPKLKDDQNHFWHINIDTRNIEQFEDGDKIFKIKQIKKIS